MGRMQEEKNSAWHDMLGNRQYSTDAVKTQSNPTIHYGTAKR